MSIIGDGTDCELVGWTSEDFGLNGAFTFPLTTNHGKGQKNQVKVCVNNIKQVFIKIKKWNTLESNFLSQWSRHYGYKRSWRGVILTIGKYALA